MRRLAFLLTGLLAAVPATAQTIAGDRFHLNDGPCTIRSGNGAPGALLGKTCDVYLDLGSGEMWTRNNVSGWIRPGGIQGSGTVGRIAKWLTAASVGDAPILHDASGNLTVDNTGYTFVNPTGSVFLGGGGNILPGSPYRHNLGFINNKFLTLHAAELWVETLVAQSTMATIGGRILVGPTNLLTRDLSPGDTTLYVKYNNFDLHVAGSFWGSRVFLESSGKFEVITIGAGAPAVQPDGSYAYGIIDRNYDGSGANQWYAGDAVFDTGGIATGATTGRGWMDLYSVRGVRAASEAGPTIVGNVRTGPASFEYQPRWAIGNLNGLYGVASNLYGAIFGKPGGARLQVTDEYGIQMIDAAGAVRILLSPAGTVQVSGDGSGVTNINGGNIQTGSISANQISLGTGRNYLRNSQCKASTEDWSIGGGPMGGFISRDYGEPWRLLGESGTCYFQSTAAPPADGTYVDIYNGQRVPVLPGQRMEMSVYANQHRMAPVQLIFGILNTAGAVIGYDYGSSYYHCPPVPGGNPPNGTVLQHYCRVWAISNPMPGDAAAIIMLLRPVATGSAASPAFLFFTNAYVGDATYYQTTPTAWAPAGLTDITGGMIRTDAIDARAIAANSISAAHVQAGQINGTHIAVNSIYAGHIVAGQVSADKISVGALSAISADLGTVTAGTLSAVTINSPTINSGPVVINTGGITMACGTAATNWYRFSGVDVGMIYNCSSTLGNQSTYSFSWYSTGGAYMTFDPTGLQVHSGGLYVATLGGSTNNYVCVSAAGNFYRC